MDSNPATLEDRRDMTFWSLVALTVLAQLEYGMSAHHWWHNWWGTLWLWPALAVSVYSWNSEALRLRNSRTVIPLLWVAGLWVLEVEYGRNDRAPWWLTHALVAAGLLGMLLLVGMSARSQKPLRPIVILIVYAALVPWIHISRAGWFWHDCYRLRIGTDVEAVAELMKSYDISMLLELERRAGASGSTMIGHSETRADVCALTFAEGKLESFFLSPD